MNLFFRKIKNYLPPSPFNPFIFSATPFKKNSDHVGHSILGCDTLYV